MQRHLGEPRISILMLDAPISYGADKLEWLALSPNKMLVTVKQWGDRHQPQGVLLNKIKILMFVVIIDFLYKY
ncbi:hypothetical protein NI467_09810 [Acinetobacter bohemicus]|uniref:hypothetical protein n=1 Tax=unclassified Acinetobacter TaxID=196816 RepID=UPI00157C5918|nr:MULTISPECIES: hypothetical protein [unclassified Acinetobacter]MCO8045641.1 hypothetical protein [Acinetobacter sp. S4397-1]MDM1782310.1 hypothetical protein [Acinetobacter indicus]QKQ69151.1 hypothetical protein E5Y90_02260 [Acinetobacter sp. 10FS3-1]